MICRMAKRPGVTFSQSNEWCYSKDNVDSNVTKYRVFHITWSIPEFRTRLNSLKQGVKCWETVSLGGQKVSLGVERRCEFRHSRPRINLVVEYEDWLDLSVRNVGDEIVWISSVEVNLASPHHSHSQQCGAVDLHQNERVTELSKFITVDRLRKEVLNSSFSGSLETVWQIKVESGGVKPPLGHICEERGDLANQFWSLFQKSLLTDYTLVCGGEEIKVHKAVLAARSEYWRALLTSGMAECEASGYELRAVSKDILHILLEFIYTGRVQDKLEPRQMELLLEAADFYGVSSLKEQCEEGLILSLEPTNLVDRLVLGDTFSAAQLRRVAKQMLIQNVDMLTDIPDWKQKLESRVSLALEVMEGLAQARATSMKRVRWRMERELREPEPEQESEEETEEEFEDLQDLDDLHGGNNVLFNDGVPVAQMM